MVGPDTQNKRPVLRRYRQASHVVAAYRPRTSPLLLSRLSAEAFGHCLLQALRDRSVLGGAVRHVTCSGDKQTKAKFGRVEIGEVAVAFGPPT
jgi:hypothetical protein